jgi:integrase/recombinase XerD
MEVRFRIKKGKESVDSKGKRQLFMFASYNGRVLRYYTKERVAVEDWNAEKERFRKSYEGYQQANMYLDALIDSCKSSYREWMSKGIIPTYDMLKSDMRATNGSRLGKDKGLARKEEQTKDMGAVSMFKRLIEGKRRERTTSNTIRNYNTTLNKILEFERCGGKLNLLKWKQSFQEFKSFLVDVCNHQPSTIDCITKHMRELVKLANEEGLVISNKGMSQFRIEGDVIYLERRELLAIESAEIPVSLERVRDCFLFACYTGLRYSDLKKVQKHNVVDMGSHKNIVVTMDKSLSITHASSTAIVPINDKALLIIEKYQDPNRKQLLPTYSNQKMNELIKVVCLHAGITNMIEIVTYNKLEPTIEIVEKYTQVTCHTARHTFATLALESGIDAVIVQKLLGHKKIETTLKYLKLKGNKNIELQTRKLLNT